MNLKKKNIPLLIMSLLFVGALTYGGFQIASAQKGESSENHFLVSKLFSQTEKNADSDIDTVKRRPPPSAENISLADQSGDDDGVENEGVHSSEETSREQNESIRSNRTRHDDDAEEGEEGDDDDSWSAPTTGIPVILPVEVPAPTTPSATPPTNALTLAQVATHNTAQNCWMVIQGKVYNVSNYIGRHPGGNVIVSGCGADATTLFNSKGGRGHSQSAWNLLPQYFVGNLGA